jgi:hypothetical protein
MTDDPFDRLMRDAAQTYNAPPEPPRADALWAAIDAELSDEIIEPPTLAVLRGNERPRVRQAPPRRTLWASPWLRMAAVLLLGVGIGRASMRVTGTESSTVVAASPDVASPDQGVTSEYLGQTTALLAELPAELRAARSDSAYLSRADDLLLRTRLLLDSPAAADPTMRSLFDDLEIVLAQVVRLNADRDPTRVDLLNQALEQRDVMPRLRDAAAENAAD